MYMIKISMGKGRHVKEMSVSCICHVADTALASSQHGVI